VPLSCLDEETIVAFIEARLTPDGVSGVEAHASSCVSCRELLSLAIAATPLGEVAGQPPAEPTNTLANATLARGTSFGRYTILEPLGRGAMGKVYAAYDSELDRKVALKILHTTRDRPDGRRRGRLLREAKAIAKLHHPNVVVIHDAGTIDDRVFLAMEHVDGQTLASWLAQRARTRKEILEVFVAAGRGLGAAHAAGLVHRDFKPQNVMVGNDGGVRVMDFGLARQIGDVDVARSEPDALPSGVNDVIQRSEEPLTRTGDLIGTPLYMAPEQFKTRQADARSDQFSFCVALYRALYGAHPFGGGKLGELIAAVTAGRVRPPPPKSAVPPWLRRALLRGLAVDPAVRWESMDALTAALSRDPARQRRRWLAGAAAAGALIAGFVAVRAPRTAESICRGGPAQLAGVWEPDDGHGGATRRRAATRAAFVNTGVENAADTWDRAARMLDRYTADWLRTYGDTCAATHLRGEQSAEVLDLRMACLQERVGRVKALTDVFVEANATVIEKAVQAASSLPALDRCADVKLLRAVMPPPEDPAVRARVESLRRDLARVRALHDSGQCTAAADAGRKLIADADALGYLPLLAESLTARGRSDCTAHEEILRDCRRAVVVGMASHHDEAVAEAAIAIAHMQADRTTDIARARDWIDIASGVMQGINGAHPVLESWRLQALGLVHSKEGDVDMALATFDRALALIEKTQGVEHLDYAIALSNLGAVLIDNKRFDDALATNRRAALLGEKIGGPDHPLVAMTVINSAEALNALHRYDEAHAASEQALRIWRQAGSNQFLQAYALTTDGEALLGQGRPHEAAARIKEALPLFGNEQTMYLQAARFALARALWESPAERPRALGLARDAKAGYQKLGNLASEVAKVDGWLQTRGEPNPGRRN
jgi:tetratricopeptide (TPR) repeat protein/tRNA A-37 threonylcarbamoyl transferase component Bud32